MEADLHIIAAFDILSSAAVTDAQLLAELQRRGLSDADAGLLLERGLMLGLLVRSAPGELTRGTETIRRERVASEPPATQ